jgi:prolyl-tRNA synthetase
MAAPEKFPTPGVRTIDDLTKLEGGAAADAQIKTLVYLLDGEPALVLLRGDHDLVEQKLADATGANEIRAAADEQIRGLLGAGAGSLGAVGVDGPRILADPALEGRHGMTTGANEDGFHLRGVDVARDIAVSAFVDLREVKEGEACPMCEAELSVRKTVEVGHIFKLGTKYSEALGAAVLDENGKSVDIVMGSYGLGIGRCMAAIVERNHDENGIVWPVNVAPYEVVVTVVNPKDVKSLETGTRLYEALGEAGIDVILDDRDERPGVKFKDAELVGIPWRITVGPKGLEAGNVEVFRRRGAKKRDVPVDRAAEVVRESVLEDRR